MQSTLNNAKFYCFLLNYAHFSKIFSLTSLIKFDKNSCFPFVGIKEYEIYLKLRSFQASFHKETRLQGEVLCSLLVFPSSESCFKSFEDKAKF